MVRSKGRGWVTQPVHTTPKTRIAFEVNNVRSVVEVELDRQGASLQGHRIPIDTKLRSGWGSVGLPGDTNPLDNRFFFVFSEPSVRRAVVVSDDVKNGEAFRRALAIPIDPRLQHRVDVISVDRVAEIDWESTGLLIWQAALPRGSVAEQIAQFVDTGRVVMFFPPSQNADERLFDSRWTNWRQRSHQPSAVSDQKNSVDSPTLYGRGYPAPTKAFGACGRVWVSDCF